MKMNKFGLVAIVLMTGLMVNSQAANVDIGSFASGSFTIDLSAVPMPTQSASGLTVAGVVATGGSFYGDFSSPLDWSNYGWASSGGSSGYTNTNLGLVMSVATNPNVNFTVTLLDNTFKVIESYSGSTSGLTSTLSFVALTPNVGSYEAGSNRAAVGSFVLGWDGDGTINTTIKGIQSTVDLAAVPEPSSASLLALGVAGLVALRVRRKS